MIRIFRLTFTLQWRHNGPDYVSNHRRCDCLLNRLVRRRAKKTSKLCVTGLCAGNSLITGEFPAQRASNVENVSIWWSRHDIYPMMMSYYGNALRITGPLRGGSAVDRCILLTKGPVIQTSDVFLCFKPKQSIPESHVIKSGTIPLNSMNKSDWV